MNVGLLEMCKNDVYNTFQILRECNVPILIAGRKRTRSEVRHVLFIDIRHLPEITGPTSLHWILDVDTGELVFETKDKNKMPHLTSQKKIYKGMKARLSDILQLPSDLVQEPQSLKELSELIDSQGMAAMTCITYMISVHPV